MKVRAALCCLCHITPGSMQPPFHLLPLGTAMIQILKKSKIPLSEVICKHCAYIPSKERQQDMLSLVQLGHQQC